MTRPMTQRSRQLALSWRANAAPWTKAVRGGTIASRRVATDAAVIGAILARRPCRVLDVGCGEGWLVRALAAEGIDATGVDGSPPLIESARHAGGGRFELLSYAEIVREPHRLGSGHDVVVLNFSIFEEESAPLLRALRSAVAPGGALLLQTVHPWTGSGRGPYRSGWRMETFEGFEGFAEPMPWYFRTLAAWIDLLREGGYRLERLDEPADPDTDEPLSLLLTAVPARGAPTPSSTSAPSTRRP